jgi:hypothetical protein
MSKPSDEFLAMTPDERASRLQWLRKSGRVAASLSIRLMCSSKAELWKEWMDDAEAAEASK